MSRPNPERLDLSWIGVWVKQWSKTVVANSFKVAFKGLEQALMGSPHCGGLSYLSFAVGNPQQRTYGQSAVTP